MFIPITIYLGTNYCCPVTYLFIICAIILGPECVLKIHICTWQTLVCMYFYAKICLTFDLHMLVSMSYLT